MSNPQVKYFSAKWCGPCAKIRPQIEPYVKKLGADFVYIDVDTGLDEQGNKHVIPDDILGVPTVDITGADGQWKGRIPPDQATQKLLYRKYLEA